MSEEKKSLCETYYTAPLGINETIVFKLDGCDINFVAEAPANIKLKDFLNLCDRIEPHWCACGVRNLTEEEMKSREENGESSGLRTEIKFSMDDVRKVDDSVSANIHKDGKWRK